MPTPPGDGLIVNGIGQVLPIGVMYLAPFLSSAPTAAPAARLGGSEPSGSPAYAKVGLLRDEMFEVSETDADVVEYRRGFSQVYNGEVVRKRGERTIKAQIDEVDPTSIGLLVGETPTNVGSPITSSQLDLGTSEQTDKTLLLVYYDALTRREFHMYNQHVLCRYKLAKNNEFMVLDLEIQLIPFLAANNKYKDIKNWMFT